VKKNLRRNYLINPTFQIKFTLLVVIFLTIITSAYPAGIYSIIELFAERLDQTYPGTLNGLKQNATEVILYLVLTQVFITAIVMMAFIFFTHRIAGPIYKVIKHLVQYRKNFLHEDIVLRKGDYFPELAEEYNETFNTLQTQLKKDYHYLGEVCMYLHNVNAVLPEDKRIVVNEIIKNLTDIQQRFNR
jgi:hypothetical protein